MGKNPAFLFYPGDWIQDTRSLSLAAKGAWIDLLCAMWRSPTRGSITLPIEGYGRLIGATEHQSSLVIQELTDMHVCDHVTIGNGYVTLTSRRMIREEKDRELTRNRVRRHRAGGEENPGNGSATFPSSVAVTVSVTSLEIPETLRGGEFEIVLGQFIEHRKEIRKPLTVLGANKLLTRMRAWGRDAAIESMNVSIENGWQGVFEPKADRSVAGRAGETPSQQRRRELLANRSSIETE